MAGVYLSKAVIPPPCYTLYEHMYGPLYFFTGKGGGGGGVDEPVSRLEG
jgi:hypothetical protein